MTAALADQRNKIVAALADEVYITHAAPGGRISKLISQIEGWVIPVVENWDLKKSIECLFMRRL